VRRGDEHALARVFGQAALDCPALQVQYGARHGAQGPFVSELEGSGHRQRLVGALRPDAARARGDARDELMGRLAEIDAELAASALTTMAAADRLALETEADGELEPFRARMSDEAFTQSRLQAMHRLARQYFGLPSF